tara:strand:- start:51 stop:242 length:192 start_codon:yes stop_codon:yes gene_type:complete
MDYYFTKIKKTIKALLPFIFAISLATFSMRILEIIGIPDGWWYFIIFLVVGAVVIDNKEKIFK